MSDTETPLEGSSLPVAPAVGAATAPGGAGAANGGSERGQTLRGLLLVGLFAAGFAIVPRLASCAGKASGEDAPDFQAHVVANASAAPGDQLQLSALRGKPVILDFWATWCGPCQAEAPIVNGIAQRFKDKGLVVVGVNTSDRPGLAEMFASRKGLRFPIVFDANDDIAHRYGVDNLPTLVVISKEGKIVAIRHGITTDGDLERLVQRVL